MALAGELAKYIGNEVIKVGGKSALSSLAPMASKVGTGLATKAGTSLANSALSKLLPNATKNQDMVTLYRGLTQKYDPKYPFAKLDTNGYESWTDNVDLARKYGDNVYSINVPKADIKTSYLDENPLSPTYGDRNPIYSIDKKAGLDGVSGKEYLLEVGTPYQEGLVYNEVPNPSNRFAELDNAMGYANRMNIPVKKRVGEYLKNGRVNVRTPDSVSIDDLDMLMGNDESNLLNKMNGNDTTADELVVRNVLKKNGISDNTIGMLKGYSDLSNDSKVYEGYKSKLSKLLGSNNKEVQKLNRMSRDILMSMGIEFEDNMPVVYRAVPHKATGDGMSYTTDRRIAEKLVKNDGGTYKKVVRYVIQPQDVVIAPQIVGPIDTGGDLRHIIVKKIKK